MMLAYYHGSKASRFLFNLMTEAPLSEGRLPRGRALPVDGVHR